MQHKLNQALDLAVSKHNILLTAKSSDRQIFIQRLFNRLPQNIINCSIDFANIKNNIDVIERFYLGITATFEQNKPSVNTPQLIKLTEFFIEDNVPIHQKCAALIAKYGFREVNNYLFSALSAYCQTNALSHVVMVIDNFENINAIKQLKLDATLRNIGQQNPFVSFIFSGDAVKVAKLFHHYQQPLYGSATPVNLIA